MDLDYRNYCSYCNTLFCVSINILSISSLTNFFDIIDQVFKSFRLESLDRDKSIESSSYALFFKKNISSTTDLS